jgi:anti-sigma B factor antagonist
MLWHQEGRPRARRPARYDVQAPPVPPSAACLQETRMTTQQSRLRIKHIGDVIQVEFLDRNILDEANIQHIGEEIQTLIESRPSPKLLISFANVDHLSSAALGTLITINNRIRNAGGQLRLSDIDPQIYEVFVITKLNKLFEIHETAADAIKSFA